MTITTLAYMIVLLLAVHRADGNSINYLTKTYESRQECEINQGVIATAAESDDSVTGYFFVHDCDQPVLIPKKA